MTQRDNILQELNELQSSLVNAGSQNVYQVPGGYFDNLVEQVLNRIKALDTKNATEELNYLSPLLSGVSKKMPYSVPAGFFDGLTESVIKTVKNNHKTPAEELEELSPLLSGLKKEMPYSIPQGYFEKINTTINNEAIKPTTKVISITRQRWFRYAAAAMIVGFIAIGGFLFLNKKENINPWTQPTEWVNKNLKKVSADDIDKFVQLVDEETPVIASTDTKSTLKDKNEIQELTKNISDKEIQDLLDDAQIDDDTDSPNNDALTN